MTPPVSWNVSVAGGVARLTLARASVRNALDDTTIQEGRTLVEEIGSRSDVRVVVIAGEGAVFCAGADLNYMKLMRDASPGQNESDARSLGGLFHAVARCPRPVIARVHGAAMGGGLGLVAACDIAVAAEGTTFALSEVRLGIIPAVISPFLVRRAGAGRLRRVFLTGARFDCAEALRLGLVDQVVAPDALDTAVEALVQDVLQAGPVAVGEAKALLDTVEGMSLEDALPETARRIARVRAGPEAQEGMAAFLEKRKPHWTVTP